MTQEIKALELNHTSSIVDLPIGWKPINCKWVYKVKYNSDDSIEKYKAHFVIQGDKQVEGFDYNEAFGPVAKMVSEHCFLSAAARKEWEMYQIDVNNVFLHGDLEEESLYGVSSCFQNHTFEQNMSSSKIIISIGIICHLQKSLYGLKQSP